MEPMDATHARNGLLRTARGSGGRAFESLRPEHKSTREMTRSRGVYVVGPTARTRSVPPLDFLGTIATAPAALIGGFVGAILRPWYEDLADERSNPPAQSFSWQPVPGSAR
jgi:hypothetical protein